MSTPHPIRLRRAGHEDAREVFAWRGHPATLAARHEVLPLGWTAHELDWKQSLGRADRVLLIGEDAWGRPVGLARFDAVDGRWAVDVLVAPERRGQGWGRALLAAGLERMAARCGAARFVAEILPDNDPARCLFSACGFRSGAGLSWVLERRAGRVEAAA